MTNTQKIFRGVLVLGLIALSPACVVRETGYHEGYREGYYDRDHHRYYHEHAWHDCVDRDEHCRD